MILVKFAALYTPAGSKTLQSGIGLVFPGGNFTTKNEQDVMAEAKRLLNVMIISVSTPIFQITFLERVSLVNYSRYR
jgi:hypothetical protein